jgi:hypothetical protein
MSQLNTDSRSTNARSAPRPSGRRTGAASAPVREASRILLTGYPLASLPLGLSIRRWP